MSQSIAVIQIIDKSFFSIFLRILLVILSVFFLALASLPLFLRRAFSSLAFFHIELGFHFLFLQICLFYGFLFKLRNRIIFFQILHFPSLLFALLGFGKPGLLMLLIIRYELLFPLFPLLRRLLKFLVKSLSRLSLSLFLLLLYRVCFICLSFFLPLIFFL